MLEAMPYLSVRPSYEEKIRALCTLSDLPAVLDFDSLATSVRAAPDPETAAQRVLKELPLASDLLKRKWHSTIMDLWSTQHPEVPLLPGLPLVSEDVDTVPLLVDAKAALSALVEHPARLVEEGQDILLSPRDVARVAGALPSRAGLLDVPVESEWAYPNVRRLRAVLQALRLLRPVKGELVVVRSRYERWLNLPPTQQFYALWHADTHHVDWAEFAGIMWGRYARVMQDYLPLLWELGSSLSAGQEVDRREWCTELLETFLPLWDEEGLLKVSSGQAAVLAIVQQQALPTILDAFVVRDLLQRQGVVTLSEEFGKLSRFTWTKVGEVIFEAELNHDLPCGRELLSTLSSDETFRGRPADGRR